MALIPLRAGEQRLGLLQLNERRKGHFSPEIIAFWERLADQLAVALGKFHAEAALRQSEKRYRSLFENMSEGLAYCKILFDSHGRPVDFVYIDVNDAFGALTGLKNVVGKKVSEVIPGIKESNPELFEAYGQVALTGKPKNFEIDVKPLGIWFAVSAYSSKREYFVAIFDNITDRKRAEEELRRASTYNRSLLEASLDPLVTIGPNGKITDVNAATEAVTGYVRTALIGKDFSDYFTEPEKARSGYQQVFREGLVRDFPLELRHRDGRVTSVLYNATVYRDDSGETIGVFAAARDITGRKRAEEELRESEERFRQVVEGAPEGMFVQVDGIFRYLNSAAIAMFGAKTADQITGQPHLDRVHPDHQAVVNERLRVMREESKVMPVLEEQYLRMDGTPFDVEVTATPFTFEGRAGSIVFIRDITERKRAERALQLLEGQFRQAQKLEAVGRLAGGIAHDFNNLLMVIRSYTEMLQNKLPADDSLRRNTQQVMKAADRAASLTQQMLAFSRKQVLSPRVIDLNAVVNDTAKMLRRLIGEDIELLVSTAESLWTVKADPDQIVQVLMNLCVNARDAMPRGGKLTLATSNVTVGEGGLENRAYVALGDYVMLSVTDTGTGMSEDVQEQIFEPFYTTKDAGKGTGLGLSTVYGIVKQSGGFIWVDSELGRGACFTVCLPREEGAIAPVLSAQGDRLPGGAETLLVVEDEDDLREAIRDFMSGLGYTVLAADSGTQALSIARGHHGPIDLLITDVVMPKMSGRVLSQMLTRLCPGLKTIYMSGYTDDSVVRHGVSEAAISFLQKPFSLETLARKVHDVIGPAEAPTCDASA